MKSHTFFKFIFAVILCQLAGLAGSIFTFQSIPTWYAPLVKPALNPPSWLFGPVWTTLYFLMGVSLFLVWQRKSKLFQDYKELSVAKRAVSIFYFQLILNVLWSVVFFGMHNPLGAFVVIVLLWLSILLNIFYFYKVSKVAAYLLIPYILWVSFASYLNFSIWLLN